GSCPRGIKRTGVRDAEVQAAGIPGARASFIGRIATPIQIGGPDGG
ncbi:MAG: hypothetical protein JWM68_462, partial [Verrucomicrobiales bacterium]|nr:hypothetical protein [Verrucomicrobiales bacterium]